MQRIAQPDLQPARLAVEHFGAEVKTRGECPLRHIQIGFLYHGPDPLACFGSIKHSELDMAGALKGLVVEPHPALVDEGRADIGRPGPGRTHGQQRQDGARDSH
jgi:hypothetical protein